MKRTIIFYGLALAILTALLKALEFRFFIRSLSLEVYLGALATIFTFLGIWIGLKLTRKSGAAHHPEPPEQAMAPAQTIPPGLENSQQAGANLSNREQEVLELMAAGLSNQEIADRLFLSLSTVKTHSSNVYAKLGVKRRTQAIQKAKTLKIIP